MCLLIEERRQQEKRLTITLDYGVHDKCSLAYELRIRQWADKGYIDVKNTDEALIEFARLNNKNQELASILEPKINQYLVVAARKPALFNTVRLNEAMFNDKGSIREGRNILELQGYFRRIMFPSYNRLKSMKKKQNADSDASHIACHYILYRDIFLTNNYNDFERAMNCFSDLIVMTPENFVNIGEGYYKD